MTQTDLVSIAMATYNGEKYLRQQLNSIYNQTYKNIEVVVTDDCSTDGTVKILEEYAHKYGLKYVVNEKNLGFTKNFEKVLSLCKGSFIAISDQDDIWVPEKIEKLFGNIKDKTLIHSDSSLMDENGLVYCTSVKEDLGTKKYAVESDKNILWVSFIVGHACLFRRELLDYALPVPPSEAYDVWLPLVASRLNGIEYLHEPLVQFRQHRTNSSKRRSMLFYSLYLKYGTYFYRIYRATRRLWLLKARGL